MHQFQWLGLGPFAPEYDLRSRGWQLCDSGDAAQPVGVLLIRHAGLSLNSVGQLIASNPEIRRLALVVEVADPRERARLLRLGFGDAIGPGSTLDELEARGLRLIEQAARIASHCTHGPLRLDLIAREALVSGRGAGLHPREFALLWRLAQIPGEPLSPRQLLGDIWHLSFRPETNSLAVHISRLRSKLRQSGLDGLIETTADGGYRLAPLHHAEHGTIGLDAGAGLAEIAPV